jgi:hypothetical protein
MASKPTMRRRAAAVIRAHRARGPSNTNCQLDRKSPDPLMKKADFARAGFIEHALWVTRHDPDQRFAAGDTPNQNPGQPGLPVYVQNDHSLVNADLVLWITIGHHHVTATEDFPVLSLEPMSFRLKPVNFFDRNPALDLRRAPFETLTDRDLIGVPRSHHRGLPAFRSSAATASANFTEIAYPRLRSGAGVDNVGTRSCAPRRGDGANSSSPLSRSFTASHFRCAAHCCARRRAAVKSALIPT